MKKILILIVFLLVGFIYFFKLNNDITLKKEYLNIKYEKVGKKQAGLRAVFNNDKVGLIKEKTNEVVVDVKYDNLYFLPNNLILTQLNNKFGLLDENGKEILKPIYDGSRDLNSNLILLNNNRKLSIFNIETKEEIILNADEILKIDNKYILAKKQGNYGIIDFEGKEVIPFEYKYLQLFIEGFTIAVNKEDKLGYINEKNEFTLKEGYQYIFEFSGNYAIAIKNEKYGMIDKTGKEVIPFEYDNLFKIAENRYGAKTTEGVILLDNNGDKINNEVYELLGKISENKIPMKKNGKYGIIDIDGKEIINPKYLEIGEFKNNLAIVLDFEVKKYGVINDKGDYVIPPEYLYIKSRTFDYFITGDEHGEEKLFNKEGKKIILSSNEVNFLNEKVALGNKYLSDEVEIIIMINGKEKILKEKKGNIVLINLEEIIIKKEGKYEIISLKI